MSTRRFNTRRTLPGKRPPTLHLDNTVANDWFVLRQSWCGGKPISPDDIQMHLYASECVPQPETAWRECCEATDGCSCLCRCDAVPTKYGDLQEPHHHARVVGGDSMEHVVLGAKDIKDARFSFHYDQVVWDFAAAWCPQGLTGIIFVACKPVALVRYSTDPQLKISHVSRSSVLAAVCTDLCGTPCPPLPKVGKPCPESESEVKNDDCRGKLVTHADIEFDYGGSCDN